jgi:hypothetical protein
MLLALPATAEWPRLVSTPKNRWVDAPKPHPLAYFTQYPSLRDEAGDFCYLCTAEKRLAEAKKTKARAKIRLIGTLNGFPVYDVFYYFGSDEKPDWKSIVVKTGRDSYREIYHDQPTQGLVNPSFLVKAGPDTLLGLIDDLYRWDEVEEYFWFEADGIIRLNFEPVWQAAKKAIPPDRSIWASHLSGPSNFPGLTISVGITYPDNYRCCAKGVVKVKFKLDRGQVVVMGTSFDPDAGN